MSDPEDSWDLNQGAPFGRDNNNHLQNLNLGQVKFDPLTNFGSFTHVRCFQYEFANN